MKQKTKAHRALHPVTREDRLTGAPKEQEEDSLIADGIRRYQQVQQEFDQELFGNQDYEKMEALLSEKQLLRERLNSYGVNVRV
jgi:hypothetical protein